MFTLRQMYGSPIQRLDGETAKQYYIRMRQQRASGGTRLAHARHSATVATQKRQARKRRNIRARAPKH